MKEKFKKLLASLAAIIMAVGMMAGASVPVMAANDDGSITISNPVANEVYNVYKVFDAVPSDAAKANTNTDKTISYTYTSTGSSDAFLTALQGTDSPFTLTQINSSNTYNVALTTGKGASDITTFLNSNVNNLGTAVKTGTGPASGTLQFTGLSYGYYYITTTTGSTVTIDSAAKDVTVTDKNTVPSMDKKQSLDTGETKTYTDDKLNANIGDTVYYQLTVTAGKTNNAEITVTDTMSNGLTLDYTSSGSSHVVGTVTKGDTAVDGSNYTVTLLTDSANNNRVNGFKIVFHQNYVKTLNENDTIVISYSATLNENAVVDSATGNENAAKMEYSHQTTEDKVYVETYDFLLKKHKASTTGEFLNGAGFKLYDAQTGGNQILFKLHDDGYYHVDQGTEADANTEIKPTTDAGVYVKGLKPGTYYLEETTTPAGYTPLTSRQAVTISADQTQAVTIDVVNNSGSILPSTGGMGTTIFYVIGGVLVAGAVILLISRKRRA